MAVTVRIPTQLRDAHRRRVGGAGRRARPSPRCSKQLDAEHPGFGERIFDESAQLRRFVNVFVADEDIRFLAGPRHAGRRGSGREHRAGRRRRRCAADHFQVSAVSRILTHRGRGGRCRRLQVELHPAGQDDVPVKHQEP